jgi:hypothetical protein
MPPVAAAQKLGEEISARTLDRALAWLVQEGDVGEKQMMNQKGKPKVYWKAYKPHGEDGSIYYRQSLTSNGENKSKGTNQETSSSESFDDRDDCEARQDGARREVVTRTPAGTVPLPSGDWKEV